MAGAGMTRLDHAVATCLGVGHLPLAPGTWGSLAALPVAAGSAWWLGPWGSALLALAATVAGVPAASAYAEAAGTPDPAPVVIDELAGQAAVLAIAPLSPLGYALGFLVFRAADMGKPPPLPWLEKLPGGWGIMADDLGAAVYAGGGVLIVRAVGLGA